MHSINDLIMGILFGLISLCGLFAWQYMSLFEKFCIIGLSFIALMAWLFFLGVVSGG